MLVQEALAVEANNTRLAHASDLSRFYGWGGCIPATVEQVCAYIAEHAQTHKAATIKRWVASISVAHQRQGLDNPASHKQVQKALRSVRNIYGTDQRRVCPLQIEQIRAIIDLLEESVADRRNKALVLIGFSGAMRGSEVVGLHFDNFRFDLRAVHICLGRTEDITLGLNTEITIPEAVDPKYCPVLAFKEWLSLSRIVEGPVFRSVNRHGHIGDTGLTIQGFEKIIKNLAARIGLNTRDYSGHSLRTGLVASALCTGKSIHKILDLTRHSTVASRTCYVPDAEKDIANMSNIF